MIDRSFFLDRAPTLADASMRLAQEFENAGIENAQLEARQLLSESTGLEREQLILNPCMVLEKKQSVRVLEWLERRIRGEPIARIRGWQEFYGRRFTLSPATLEPRADTETLIGAALQLMNRKDACDAPFRVLDVGTGTGCLALTLLAEWPHATATAVDICSEALNTARRNAINLGVDKRLTLLKSNYLESVEGVFDLLISNPPYIKSGDIDTLQNEVLHYDPVLALDGGCDGLQPYRLLAQRVLNSVVNGFVIVEIACNDAERVIAAMSAKGHNAEIKVANVWKDLSGCERCVAFQIISQG